MKRPGGYRSVAVLLVVAFVFGGCAGQRATSSEFFVLAPESAANKAMQTREFETKNSDELLSASASVLQDLGFQITETDRGLGFLRATKERSARERGQEISRASVGFLTFLLTLAAAIGGGGNVTYIMPIDLQQQFNASLVATPLATDSASEDGERNLVRVTFYRLVWKGDGQSGGTYIPPGEQKMEMIRDAELYQQFFARLSKAVFLEAHKI